MTGLAVGTVVVLALLVGEYLWLRPAARSRLYLVLVPPLRRRARNARRSLDALDRATSFHLYRPRHLRRTP